MGKSGIRNAYTTGRGRVILRAKAEIEEDSSGKARIVVSEIPYLVNKARLEKHINELVRDGKIDGIASTRDESDEEIRFIIELKRDANPNVVLNNLYKFSQMQDTFGVILLALVDKQPKILNLREMIDYYIAHQEDVIRRRTTYELRKAQERAHILEGYRTVIDNIDEVVHIIRASKSIPEAKEQLAIRFDLDDVQTTAIVQMTLGRLTGMERDKIENEYEELMIKISEYQDILANESRVLQIVKDDLTEIKNKYGDSRRTDIEMVFDEIDMEDLIDEEECIVTVTHNGYVKRLPVDTYRSQRRGGRGVMGMTTREEDFVEHLFTTSTHHHILFFTTKGIVYRLKGYQIPEAARQAKGTAIVNLLPLEPGEKISAMIPVAEFEKGDYLTFITRNGLVKKTDIMDYSKIRQNGLRAIEIVEGDELIQVAKTDGESEIMLISHDGLAIRFAEKDVRAMGRTTRGVKGMTLREGDYVVGACAGAVTEGATLLVVTEYGYGKKTEFEEYRLQTRGGKGLYTYRITEKTGKVAGVEAVTDNDDIMMITSEGVVIRMHADEISTYGRQTQGVRLMRLDEGVKVVSSALTEREEESEAVTPDNEVPTDDGEALEDPIEESVDLDE